MMYRETLRNEFLLRGEPILYWQYVGICPCTDSVAMTHDRQHALCGGTGVLRESVDVSTYKALVTGYQQSKAYHSSLGELPQGSIGVSTFPDEIPLAEQDLIAVSTRFLTISEELTRGAGATDNFTRGSITSIDRVFDTAGAITTGFAISSGKNGITWTGGPDAGDTYTVLYTFNPQFIMIKGTLKPRRTDLLGLPFPVPALFKIMNPTETDYVG